jgi:hypothetical protein
MRDATQHQQDFTELAQHAFADNGYVPSTALLKATAKGLVRLADPSPVAVRVGADVSFDDMLRSCAGA